MAALWLVAVALLALTPTASAKTPASKDAARLQSLYREAYGKFRDRCCLPRADSVFSMAMAAGNTRLAAQALAIPIKYECTLDSNYAAVCRAADRLMDFARKHKYTDFFYSGVSYRVTYLINHAQYDAAMRYQQEMLDYAKRRGDSYGVAIGYVSTGNLYRKRLHMAQAIAQYELAIDAYRKYNIKRDLGADYRRIVECYLIAGNFAKVVEVANRGLASTNVETLVSGFHGYKAFAYFMLGNDREFYENFAKYYSYKSSIPDVEPFVGNCIETMKLIYDGNYSEAERRLAETGIGTMGAYRTYVKMAYYQRRGMLAKQLDAMRQLNVSLYGNGRGTLAADWARTEGMVSNQLSEIDRQRAANINSRLELVRADLELQSTQLELSRARDAEHLAFMEAEAKRLSLNNQRLLSRQLRDSLATQQLRRKAQEEGIRSGRIKFVTLLIAIIVLTMVAYHYMARNIRMTRRLKRANADLQKTLADLSDANDQAQASDRKKTQFIPHLSHEIRTPLNAIVGFSQVLAEQELQLDATERENMARIIDSNSDTLNTLINGILDLTSIESGKYVMKSEAVSVNALCHVALDAARSHKAEGVHLRLETDLPDSFTIMSDRFRLQQVVENLLSNAVKNTPEGSIVLGCSLAERPGMLTFTVTDTGIGVPPDKQKVIFERFSKLDQFKQGIGLGLDVCRIIAAKLGGAVDIDPSYTGGARFWFAVPIGR